MKEIAKLTAMILAAAIAFSCSDMIADLGRDASAPPPPADLPPVDDPPEIIDPDVILRASDMQENDYFGGYVSISGDYAIIGAGLEDGGDGDPVPDAGAAYIFERDAEGTWTQQAILRASDMQSEDNFGGPVCISGSYAIVGAPYEWGGSGDPVPYAGAAYIFERNAGGTWVQRAILHASDMETYDRFGGSVSISGGYAIVGAGSENGGSGSPAYAAGAAYVFERNAGGTWVQRAILHASNMQSYDEFGESVSMSGSYAIIGAPGEDGSGSPWDTPGAAYIFERNAGGTWVQRAILHASDAQVTDGFGTSVSISEGYAIVGAFQEDGGSGDPVSYAGAAYIFERDAGGNWVERTILHAYDMQSTDYFGWSVSINGGNAIVGAVVEDGGSGSPVNNAGAAYVFERDAGGNWVETTILHPFTMQVDDYFGSSVAMGGSCMFISAYSEDGGSGDPVTGAGAVYIFEN